ncbi:MAG TPA: cell division protein ZapB [Acidobacteriota bacterium]|nr:cell division protein ZapB [Acidobacteriota bacterium]
MSKGEEIEQFQLLEEKVNNLISLIMGLKKEKESLTEKSRIQEEKLTDLTQQLEDLRGARDKTKQRIVSLLEKIEQVEI